MSCRSIYQTLKPSPDASCVTLESINLLPDERSQDNDRNPLDVQMSRLQLFNVVVSSKQQVLSAHLSHEGTLQTSTSIPSADEDSAAGALCSCCC